MPTRVGFRLHGVAHVRKFASRFVFRTLATEINRHRLPANARLDSINFLVRVVISAQVDDGRVEIFFAEIVIHPKFAERLLHEDAFFLRVIRSDFAFEIVFQLFLRFAAERVFQLRNHFRFKFRFELLRLLRDLIFRTANDVVVIE